MLLVRKKTKKQIHEKFVSIVFDLLHLFASIIITIIPSNTPFTPSARPILRTPFLRSLAR